MYDSLKILGLGLGAPESEVKLAYCYRRLTLIFHPDKWEHSHHTTGMTLPETTTHF
jgi:DnaJ-class molecular chaperone